MSGCQFLKDISSYLDSQLSENKKLRMEEHLKQCKACNEELANLRALSQKLKSWQAPVLDLTFDSLVKNKIVALELAKETGKMKRKTLSILIPSGAVAGILIVSFLSFQMYMKNSAGGRLKLGVDEIGGLYEPYYSESSYDGKSAQDRGNKKQVQSVDMAHRSQTMASADKFLRLQSSANNKEDSKEKSSGVYHNEGREGVNFFSPDADFEGQSIVGRRGVGELAKSELDVYARKRIDAGFQSGEGSVIVIQPTLPATGVGEMIIRSAELTLEVESGKEVYRKIADICREFGGYQAESNFSKDTAGRESGRVTLRIPKDKFLSALDKLSELGKVKANNTYSQDVSQDYANLKAQLDAAMVVYNKMLEALQKRQTSITEAVRLESELTPVLRKIENLKNQIEKLNNLTSFTTITVNFYEAEVSAKVLEETKQLVKENMLAAKINAVRYFAKNLPFLGLVVGLAIVAFVVILLCATLITHLTKRG